MPNHDSITISLTDLDNVVQLIEQKKTAGDAVEITMINDKLITVRDTTGFLIGSLQQTIQE